MQVRYAYAKEWGGVWVRPPIAEKLPDDECFHHHTAGNTGPDAFAAFRASNEYATRPKDQGGRGYSFLGYDVLWHYNPHTDIGTIGEGRGKWLSAATLDRNEQGEAVCGFGYFHPGHSLSRHPFDEEIELAALAAAWGTEEGWITRGAVQLGHRDNPAHPGATGCPGDYFYVHMPTVRQRYTELTSIPQPPERPMTRHVHRKRILDTRVSGMPVQPGAPYPVALGVVPLEPRKPRRVLASFAWRFAPRWLGGQVPVERCPLLPVHHFLPLLDSSLVEPVAKWRQLDLGCGCPCLPWMIALGSAAPTAREQPRSRCRSVLGGRVVVASHLRERCACPCATVRPASHQPHHFSSLIDTEPSM